MKARKPTSALLSRRNGSAAASPSTPRSRPASTMASRPDSASRTSQLINAAVGRRRAAPRRGSSDPPRPSSSQPDARSTSWCQARDMAPATRRRRTRSSFTARAERLAQRAGRHGLRAGEDRVQDDAGDRDDGARHLEPDLFEPEAGECEQHARQGDQLGTLLQLRRAGEADAVGRSGASDLGQLGGREHRLGVDAALDGDERLRDPGWNCVPALRSISSNAASCDSPPCTAGRSSSRRSCPPR